jgi:hypothetical protein
VFAIVRLDSSFKNFEESGCNWRSEFLRNQHEAAYGASQDYHQNKVTFEHKVVKVNPRSNETTGSKQAPAGKRMSLRAFPWMVANANNNRQSGARTSSAGAERPQMDSVSSNMVHLETLRKVGRTEQVPELKTLKQRADSIASVGGHYVMVVLAGNPWGQMKALLNTLRGDHCPFHVPIIILVHQVPSTEVLSEIFTSTARLGLITTGPLATLTDLANAGMLKARCIMLYAGNAAEATTHDRRMIDGAGVTMLAAIEGALCEAKKSDTSIVLELHRQDSVKFMHRFPLYEEEYSSEKASWAYDPRESFTNHPRFASGGIFTASCLGALVARSFYTPGVVELLESIVLQDDNDQNSFPWQVSLPPGFAGKTYGDIVQDFLSPKKGALCLGLYRRSFPGTGSTAGYVVTNPHPSTPLRHDDLVTVLAPKAFGDDCFDQGMIPAAIGAPRADDPEDEAGQPAASIGAANREESGNAVVKGAFAAGSQDASRSPSAGAFPAGADEAGGISQEAPIPSLYELQLELATTQRALNESMGRENALRAQLRACSFPLPATLETPRSRGQIIMQPPPRGALQQSPFIVAAAPPEARSAGGQRLPRGNSGQAPSRGGTGQLQSRSGSGQLQSRSGSGQLQSRSGTATLHTQPLPPLPPLSGPLDPGRTNCWPQCREPPERIPSFPT